MKKNTRQMIPVLLVIGITLLMSLLLYSRVMKREEEKCWQLLEDSAASVTQEIRMMFEDNISTLHLATAPILQGDVLSSRDNSGLQLESFHEHTLFSRIDILYPDGTVLLEDGSTDQLPPDVSFREIASGGEHISTRRTDTQTSLESLFYFIPMEKDGQTAGILCGVIDTASITTNFHATIYNGQANCCIIDSHTGDYLMDQWHDTLGNAFETPARERLKGYEDVDLKSEIRNLNTGILAFISNTNGRAIYMYYTPIELFDWELLIFTQEDIIFADMLYLKELLIIAGIVEAVLLCLYLLWTLHTIRELTRQQEQLQFMSYHDNLTGLYNRNKYNQVLEQRKAVRLHQVGAAYLDLNGLKQVNDIQGHEAGDALIRRAAHVISEVFPESSYRIGGDEFVILMFRCDQDSFEERLEHLRKAMAAQDVSVSLGFLWQESCDDLEELLKEADRKMYLEKEQHYQRTTPL